MVPKLLFLFFVVFLVNTVAAQSETVIATNSEICTDLCRGCGGVATFSNKECKCRVSVNDSKAVECIKSLNQRNEDMNVVSTFSNGNAANRGIRCSPSKLRRTMGPNDVDRIVNYFVNSGPMSDMPFAGRANCPPSEARSATESPTEDHLSQLKNPDSSEDKPDPKKSKKAVAGKGLAGRKKGASDKADENTELSDAKAKSSEVVGLSQRLKSRYGPSYTDSIIGSIPRAILGIPHALLRSAIVGPMAPHHLPSWRKSQPVLGSSLAGLPILRNGNNLVLPYMSANEQGTILNPQTRAALTPLPIPYYGFAGQPYVAGNPQYAPVVGSVGPQGGKANSLPVTPDDDSLTKQNNLFDSVNQQMMRNYVPAGIVQHYPYAPMPYVLGAPSPIQSCNCEKKVDPVVSRKHLFGKSTSRDAGVEDSVTESSEPLETTTLQTSTTATPEGNEDPSKKVDQVSNDEKIGNGDENNNNSNDKSNTEDEGSDKKEENSNVKDENKDSTTESIDEKIENSDEKNETSNKKDETKNETTEESARAYRQLANEQTKCEWRCVPKNTNAKRNVHLSRGRN